MLRRSYYSRRELLFTGMANFLIGQRAQEPVSSQHFVAPRTNVLATVYSMNTRGFEAAASQTFSQVWPVPDDVSAIGVIVLNDTASPWRFSKIIAAPSASAVGADDPDPNAHYMNPSPAPPAWTPISWDHNGELVLAPKISGARYAFSVPGNIVRDPTTKLIGSPDTYSHLTNIDRDPDVDMPREVPNFYFSDLVPFNTTPPESRRSPRFIFTRMLLPRVDSSVRGIHAVTAWPGNMRARGWDWATRVTDEDIVTTPAKRSVATPFPYSPIAGLIYQTPNPGVQLLISGDSHAQGAGTTLGYCNFAFLSMVELNRPGSCPVGYVNAAMTGRPSDTFWPVLMRLLIALHPGIAIIQGWTANDSPPEQREIRRYLDRVAVAMKQVRAYGGMPLPFTPFPRNASFMTPPVLAAWRDARARLLEMATETQPIIDATPVLGRQVNGEFDGTYRNDLPKITLDNIHPGDAGHELVAIEAAIPLLRRLIS
jgi:hypothetical protein